MFELHDFPAFGKHLSLDEQDCDQFDMDECEVLKVWRSRKVDDLELSGLDDGCCL